MKKSEKVISKSKSIFLALTIINLFTGFVSWAISFWVYLASTKQGKVEIFVTPDEKNSQSENNSSNNEMQGSTIVLNEEDYKERNIANDLTEKLEAFKKMLDKKLITEQEYKSLREKALKDFIE